MLGFPPSLIHTLRNVCILQQKQTKLHILLRHSVFGYIMEFQWCIYSIQARHIQVVLPLQVELLKLGYYHTIVTDGQATTWLQQCFLIHKIVNKARHKLVRLLGSSETLYTIQKQFQSRSLLKLSFICLIPQSKNLQAC